MPGESFKQKLHHPWFGGALGGALLALAGILLLISSFGRSSIGRGMENWSYDLPFLLRGPQPVEEVVLIKLEQDSYRRLKQRPESFDRGLHAQLVRQLSAAGAKWIVFDIAFLDERAEQKAGDQKFAAALRAATNVILAADLHHDRNLGADNDEVTMPIDLFRDAAAAIGLSSAMLDPDSEVRQIHPGTSQMPGLAWRVAELNGASVTRNPESRFEERWLNYYSIHPFRSFSYADVITNSSLSDSAFRGKVVFVGSGNMPGFSGQEKEQVRTPWTWQTDEWGLGLEVHALTYANLQRGDWFRRWPTTLEAFMVGAAGLLLGLGVSRLKPLGATGLSLGVALAVIACSVVLTTRFNTWFPWLIVVGVQVPIALGWSYFLHSMRAYVEAKVLQSSMELYLSPPQVKQILKTPALLKPGAEQKTVSILFSDIAGFSKISERMDPDDLVKLLNAYYETAIGCVHETGGTVMNLIGDAIFAIWNAPQEQPDHQARACRAAMLLNQALVKFESNSQHLPLNTRVGLHTGVVCVGNIGSTTRFEYTAIGESVNMAARLEGLNKQLGTNILATRDIQKTIGDKLVARLVGHFKFKGFDQVVEIHEMVGLPASEAESRAWRQTFAAALSRYQRKAFTEAEEGFRKTLELRPGDGPSRFYLDRIPALQATAPASDWFGEVDLREK